MTRENYDEDKKLRDLRFLLDFLKTVRVFDNSYIQYESIGDKDKNLSIKEYIDIVRSYLIDIIKKRKENGKFITQ